MPTTEQPDTAAAPAAPGYQREGRSSELARRLRRIEGQVRGIEKMLADGRYCIDVLTQLEATRAALARVQDGVLDGHLNHCVTDALAGKDPAARQQKFDEVVALLRQFRGRS
ncbi:MAG: metal-sensitive transcriptional regulator [Gemmatimonadota bacterium]